MNACALTLAYDTPDLVATMRAQLPSVRVIDNGSRFPIQQPWMRIPVNRYWSGGFNRAMERIYLEGEYEWAWLLNSDVQGVTPEMMEQLLDLAVRLGLCMISPAVHTSIHKAMHKTAIGRDTFIDCVAPLVNVKWFIGNGGLDESLPGFGADIDLCYRTLRDPKAVAGLFSIDHPYGGTVNRTGDRTQCNVYSTQRYLIEKHGPAILSFLPLYFVGYKE